ERYIHPGTLYHCNAICCGIARKLESYSAGSWSIRIIYFRVQLVRSSYSQSIGKCCSSNLRTWYIHRVGSIDHIKGSGKVSGCSRYHPLEFETTRSAQGKYGLQADMYPLQSVQRNAETIARSVSAQDNQCGRRGNRLGCR